MEYNRDAAVAYAREWALSRNPRYYDFEELGGDCTNFASQSLLAGAGVMNYTRDTGWYYNTTNDRAAAWTSAEYFGKFMTSNKGAGPYGRYVPLEEAQAGDFVQLMFAEFAPLGKFTHTLVLTDADNMLVASHSFDSLDRPLATYYYEEMRVIHIEGVRG
jgi:hypothetical protein